MLTSALGVSFGLYQVEGRSDFDRLRLRQAGEQNFASGLRPAFVRPHSVQTITRDALTMRKEHPQAVQRQVSPRENRVGPVRVKVFETSGEAHRGQNTHLA